jgi:Protein of unknown function (DUF2695)
MPEKSERKQLSKAWKAGEREKARARFPLAHGMLEAFFADLEHRFAGEGCFHDTRHAQRSIDALRLSDDDANALLDWCRDHGGHCDCEIAANAQQHWIENRSET